MTSHPGLPDSRPDLGEQLHERVVDHERNGHVQTDPGHARNGALVEGGGALVDPDLPAAVPRVFVLVRLEALHARLDDVDRGVSEDGRRAGHRSKRA